MTALFLHDQAVQPAVRHDLGAPAPRLALDEETLLPPRATAEGTLRRMLLSALVLFGEKGYHAVSVRQIAKAKPHAHTADRGSLLRRAT